MLSKLSYMNLVMRDVFPTEGRKERERERFSCKMSLQPGSSKRTHPKAWLIRTIGRGEADPR